MKTTREPITDLAEGEIFVFGSNRAGRHGRGAALLAARKFGAKYGQGNGIMGRSYGISTKDERLRVLSLNAIWVQVSRFIRYAEAHPENTFLVTQIGCGLAGYSPKEIAPLFGSKIPENVAMPGVFQKWLA